MSADDYRAQLVAVAADAIAEAADRRWRELVGDEYDHVRDLFVERKPDYRSALAEAVIDALGIERLPDPPQPTTVMGYPSSFRWRPGRPVFTLGAVTDPSLTSET